MNRDSAISTGASFAVQFCTDNDGLFKNVAFEVNCDVILNTEDGDIVGPKDNVI